MDNEVTDSCGIPGWDKVDALAVALIEPKGLSVTPAQAETIIQRYGALLEYDKHPIQFQQTLQQKPLRGRFARIRQYRVGHVSLEKMKGCFLSGGAPACSPSKSRIVEAILIHLLEDITQPRREVDERGKNKYTSRYKLVLSAYNSIRARVLNSDILMQRTNLMLVNLNEFTLLRWYKNSIRRDEIKLLMQGFTLPQPQPCTNDPLLPAKILPTSPPAPPEDCHIFHEVDDQTGLARLRDKSSTQVIIAPTTPVTIPATSGTTSATLIDPAAIPLPCLLYTSDACRRRG